MAIARKVTISFVTTASTSEVIACLQLLDVSENFEISATVMEMMIDLTNPKEVEIRIEKGASGKYVIWVNVDELCVLRISRVNPENITINSALPGED